jgi:CheY-like chemotaxis protein
MAQNRNGPVLIVEDEPDFADLLAYGLSARGYDVVCAADGLEALEVQGKGPVSVVITDVRMPRMDGLELLCRLKQNRGTSPAVILTTANPDVTAEQAHALGAEAMFCKPFRLTELMSSVARLTRPLAEWWGDKADASLARSVQCRFASLDPGDNDHLCALGRGGIQIPVREPEPYVGLQVRFNVDVATGPIRHLAGTGVTRWTRLLHGDEAAWACGVEFEYLDDETRVPFLDWLRDVNPLPYIPSVGGNGDAEPDARG